MKSPSPDLERICADPYFPALKHFVITETGLSYYQDKDVELAAAVKRAQGEKPWSSAGVYLSELSGPGETLDRLAEELTIGETFFFRHVEMFSALREHVFPALHQMRAEEKRLRIWSAGCSIGAEPYSLSVLLRTDLAHLFHDWRLEIIGTDINRRFLQIAREAVFQPWALRGMAEAERDRCFEKRGREWALLPPYRQDVVFQMHNLARDRFPSLPAGLFGFDLIICRNVMIYFNTATVTRLAEQFEHTLVSGGWLAVGHAEPHTEIFRAFETVNAPGAILYHRRSSRSPAQAPSVPWIAAPVPLQPLPRLERTPMPATTAGLLRHRVRPPEQVPADASSQVRGLADTGNVEEALRVCETSLAADRLNVELHLLHGILLEQAGRANEAGSALQRCVYLDHQLPLAHYHLAMVQRQMGQERDFARSLRNARELLAGQRDEALVRFGGELMAGELRGLIDQQATACP